MDKTELEIDPVTECTKEISALLDKYKCELVSMPVWRPDGRGGWYTDIQLQVKPRLR